MSYDALLCAEYCNNEILCPCTLWGFEVKPESAINYSHTQDPFQAVVASSNGLEKTNKTTPATQPGWQEPKQCGGDGSKAHNHPSTSISTNFFPRPYKPALCAAYANFQNSISTKSPLWYK
ncbi:hypothetical protein WAI453_012975 [Rhynchosporium graminicola]